MTTYKIEATVNNFFIAASCSLCYAEFEPSNVRFILYEDGERVGEVCDACARSTPVHVGTRATNSEEHFHALARQLHHIAQDFESDPPDVVFPTPEQIAKVEQEAREMFEEYHTETTPSLADNLEKIRKAYYKARAAYVAIGGDPDDEAPPPDDFPDGWDNEWTPGLSEVEITVK